MLLHSITQMLLGLSLFAAGAAGVFFWTHAHLVYIPVIVTGMTLFCSGIFIVKAADEKTRSVGEAAVASAVTVLAFALVNGVLVQATINLMTLMKSQHYFDFLWLTAPMLETRRNPTAIISVDSTIFLLAVLAFLVSLLSLNRLQNTMRLREEDQLLRLNYRTPVSSNRDSVLTAWPVVGPVSNPGYQDIDVGYPSQHMPSPASVARGSGYHPSYPPGQQSYIPKLSPSNMRHQFKQPMYSDYKL